MHFHAFGETSSHPGDHTCTTTCCTTVSGVRHMIDSCVPHRPPTCRCHSEDDSGASDCGGDLSRGNTGLERDDIEDGLLVTNIYKFSKWHHVILCPTSRDVSNLNDMPTWECPCQTTTIATANTGYSTHVGCSEADQFAW